MTIIQIFSKKVNQMSKGSEQNINVKGRLVLRLAIIIIIK